MDRLTPAPIEPIGRTRRAGLCNAADLEQWSELIESRQLLPQLVRRLLQATAGPQIESLSFPSEEATGNPGWDGQLRLSSAVRDLPAGESRWELGTSADVTRKANEDYVKRTSEPLGAQRDRTTFVFVSSRNWRDREAWLAGKRENKEWRQVLAYDANSLQEWLERAPAVHHWLSRHLGCRLPGAQDIEEFFQEWSAVAPIPAGAYLAGRAIQAERIRNWLQGQPTTLRVEAQDLAEVLPFVGAVILSTPEPQREALISRMLVIEDPESWRQLAHNPLPLILAWRNGLPPSAPAAHHVLLAVAQSGSWTLPPLKATQLEDALRDAGLSRSLARRLRVRSAERIAVLRRAWPESQAPAPVWATGAQAPLLVPAFLLGAWDESCPADREALQSLTGRPCDQLLEQLQALTVGSDPPLEVVGHSWRFISRLDSWRSLAPFLTEVHLERFQALTLNALAEPDPSLDHGGLPLWEFPSGPSSPSHSRWLRAGLCDSLALMGAFPAVCRAFSLPVHRRAESVVRSLLEREGRIWASLETLLPLLAEAAPEAFLGAVRHDLQTGGQRVRALIDWDRETGLLWALEQYASQPEYISELSLILADLSELHSDSRAQSQPMRSLRRIHLAWCPQTGASLEQRWAALDHLCRQFPNVAWELLWTLLPRLQGDSTEPTHPTTWREWESSEFRRPPARELVEHQRRCSERLIELCSEEGRWTGAINQLANLDRPGREAFLAALERGLATLRHTPAGDLVWAEMRSLLNRHRLYPEAEWSLPESFLTSLEGIYEQLTPADPLARVGWRFQHRPEFPNGAPGDPTNWRNKIRLARVEAVRELIQIDPTLLIALAGEVESPADLGFLAAQENSEGPVSVLSPPADFRTRADFWRGFVAGGFEAHGTPWLQRLLQSTSIDVAQKGSLLTHLPLGRETWDLVTQVGGEDAYWREVPVGCAISLAEGNLDTLIRELCRHGRGLAALEPLYFRTGSREEPAPELVVFALAHLGDLEQQAETAAANWKSSACELLDWLEGRISDEELASLERPLLKELIYRRKPRALHRSLARSAQKTHEVILEVFRADDDQEQRALTQEEVQRAEEGYQILDSWRCLPAEGVIGWAEELRELCRESRHLRVFHHFLGQLIAFASRDEEDSCWPAREVRDLIESIYTPELASGVVTWVFNKEGSYAKCPREGGLQERGRGRAYSDGISVIAPHWPNTALILRQIDRAFEDDAYREDLNSAQYGWLLTR